MLHALFDRGDWFAQKSYGYGAGLPITWQGWAAIAAYLMVMLGAGLALVPDNILAFAAVTTLATAMFVVIAARKTRGGWRWRWGD